MNEIGISIHAARVGCDKITGKPGAPCTISIHAARVGCDDGFIFLLVQREMISIHAARVGCDAAATTTVKITLSISIHAARVGCDNSAGATISRADISIHAARVGCDKGLPIMALVAANFNPRSPSGLRLALSPSRSAKLVKFQSTQPEWAATI